MLCQMAQSGQIQNKVIKKIDHMYFTVYILYPCRQYSRCQFVPILQTILLCQKKKLMCTMWTLQLCCFLHLQIGEQQLKSLLERVSEQTAKKTTVKVGPKEAQRLYLRKGEAHMHYVKNFVFTIKRGMVTILNKFYFCVFITAIKNA